MVPSDPSVGAALIVRLYVPLATTPFASVTLSWMLLNVPAPVGVPLIVIVLPLSEAVRPVGRPLCVNVPNGPVPLLMKRDGPLL